MRSGLQPGAIRSRAVALFVRGQAVHAEQHGAGRPILFLHGSPTDHRELSLLFEPVFETRSGWQRTYPDLPGHGRTPRDEQIRDHEGMVEWAADLLDAVADADGRLTLVGSSYGGYLALRLLERYTDRFDGVLLQVPAVALASDRLTLPQRRVLVEADEDLLAELGPGEQFWPQIAVIQTRDTLARFRSRIAPGVAAADMDYLDSLDGVPAPTAQGPAEPFDRPTLVITGRHDQVVGFADVHGLVGAFPRGSFAVLDGAGHAVANEQPTLWRALVEDWLDRVEAEASRSADR